MRDPAPEQEEYADVVARLLVRVYEIHERVLSKGGGGLPGIREAGLLHAAVARPFATFLGEELYPTDFEKAAALFHSLIKSHPFMDGTKRTAFASAMYFLGERGYRPGEPLPMDEIIEYCVSLAEENLRMAGGEESKRRSITQIAAWFQGLFSLDE
jgi:death-on-curing protein